MKKKNRKKLLVWMLCGILLLSAGGCKKNTGLTETEQTEQTEADTASYSTEKTSLPELGKKGTAKTENQETTNTSSKNRSKESKASLQSFRNTMVDVDAVIGIAYLGYVGGLFEEGFDAGFPAWMEENNMETLDIYPFLASIDSSQIVGSAGHLYAVIPRDENASLAINRFDYDRVTGSYDDGEVIYRSESGEPVLLFANLDGDSFFPDTEVLLTDDTGETYTWYPCMSEKGYLVSCYREGREVCSLDFTEYSIDMKTQLAYWMVHGWLGPTELSISGTEEYGRVWHIWSTAWETGRDAFFMMQFYPSDGTSGRVDIDWNYEGERDYEEQWSGYWNLTTRNDWPSYLTLSLSRVGGKNYETTDGPMYIVETYPVLISPNGGVMVMGYGTSGICLPFMSQNKMVTTMWLPDRYEYTVTVPVLTGGGLPFTHMKNLCTATNPDGGYYYVDMTEDGSDHTEYL